ncbi:hypothetical protein [Paenibacillus sp. Marseille-Q4541]|uniref:hypothetical protein n=1 Tax=Paenibacillus sp. Marseille-Q4541 TaxID=2831522 RepID=UPI001BAA79AE|nr:hypothetical protein [Paenibacillus sp. Marseille-Q4541]
MAMNIALMESTAANGKRYFPSAFKSTYTALLNLIKEQFTNEQIKTLLGDAAREFFNTPCISQTKNSPYL